MLNWQPLRTKALCQLCVLGFFGVAVGCLSTHGNATQAENNPSHVISSSYSSSPPSTTQ